MPTYTFTTTYDEQTDTFTVSCPANPDLDGEYTYLTSASRNVYVNADETYVLKHSPYEMSSDSSAEGQTAQEYNLAHQATPLPPYVNPTIAFNDGPDDILNKCIAPFVKGEAVQGHGDVWPWHDSYAPGSHRYRFEKDLKERGYISGDLHRGNVLLTNPKARRILDRYTVVDAGFLSDTYDYR